VEPEDHQVRQDLPEEFTDEPEPSIATMTNGIVSLTKYVVDIADTFHKFLGRHDITKMTNEETARDAEAEC
jgi:hypothetical protein